MGKYVTRIFKGLIFAAVVRFNYAETYYPGLAEVRQYREKAVVRREIGVAPYRQSYYLTPAYNYPQLYLGNGPIYVVPQGSYNIILK